MLDHKIESSKLPKAVFKDRAHPVASDLTPPEFDQYSALLLSFEMLTSASN
jgi:hypothetical protein